jgi:hypothetical protein
MNFLNPAVLLGLIAAAMPLILHLLNLRKLKTVEFSSLQFLKEMQKNKIRRLKLKQIILLIIRTLLIICIVLAFARPAIDGTIPGFESLAKSSYVILFDNSFSLDFSDEYGNRLNQAKKAVNEILQTMNEGDEIVIVEMANSLNSKVYEFTRNIDLIKDELEKIKISYQPADFEKSLALASKILENSTNFSKDIYIISDVQPNIFDEKNTQNNTKAINTEVEKINAEHSNIYLIPIGYVSKADIKNYSIDSINIISQIFQLNKSVETEANIKNNSKNPVSGLLMGLSFNNERVSQRTFDLQESQARNISIGAIPATSGIIKAYVELENDIFDADNKKYFGFMIPDKPNIAIFGDNQRSDFINIALSATGKDGFAKANNFQSNEISNANLSQFDLVILSGGSYNSSDFNLLKQYVSNGGNAFIFANNQIDINIFSSAMNEFGFGEVKLKEFSQNQPNQFTNTDKIHPLFDGVFKIDNDSRSIVESPKIYKALPAISGQSLIEMGSGFFLAESILGDGKFLYCAVPPTLEWSNFPVTGIFPAIIIRSIAYLASHPELSYNFEIGKNSQIMIQKKYSTGGNFRIIDPNGNEFLRQAALLPSGAVLNFEDMNLPGVYTIFNSNNVVVALVSLNLEASESDFTKFSTKELNEKIEERFENQNKIIIVEDTDEISENITRARTGTELWRFFILLAILLAITEMLIQKNFKNEGS